MTVVTLDFETYFDDALTLRKLTTEAYVRHPDAHVLCASVKRNEAPACDLPLSLLPQALDGAGVVCHHAHFDGLVLSHKYNIRPAFWFDTLSMARLVFPHAKSHSLGSLAELLGIGQKSVPYSEFKGKTLNDLIGDPELFQRVKDGCIQDVELTYQIFRKLLQSVPHEELRVIDLNIRLFTEPVLSLDRERVKKYTEELGAKQEEILKRAGITDKKILASNKKFAELLDSMGIDPPVKISKTTGRETLALSKTDQGFIDLLEHPDDNISLLAEARLSAKSTLGSTRAERLLSMASRGNLCVYLKHAGAHTFRFSGGDKLNFQNLPRGGELRKSILSPDGYVIVVVDSAQIECRILNYLAREKWVLDAFREHRDLYSETASRFYGWTITKADKLERFLGKTLELGAGYGVGWKKVMGMLKLNGISLTEDEARRAVDVYRETHPGVVNLWCEGDSILETIVRQNNDPSTPSRTWGPVLIDSGHMVLPNGTAMDYTSMKVRPDARNRPEYYLDTARGPRKFWGGVMVENLVQALAGVYLKKSMLRLSKLYRIVMDTHDEIAYLAPEDEAETALEIGLRVLRVSPDWAPGIPLDAEGGFAREYSK